MQRNKRRLVPIICPPYQYRFLAMVIIYNSIIVAFVAICVFVPDIIQMVDESLDFKVRAAAAEKILLLHGRIWPALIALICLIGLHSLRVFNRFIGPLYRFRSAFKRVREGDLRFRVQIRKNDFLHHEEQLINEMIEGLSGKIRSIQHASDDTLKSLNELKQMLNEPENNRKQLNEFLLTYEEQLNTMTNAAHSFHLETSKQRQ